MNEPPIINCHIHTFTVNHVPTRKVPVLMHLLRWKPLREGFRGVLSTLVFWDERDRLRRFAQFVKMTYGKSQESVFNEARRRYPNSTRYVVLPMDMAYMGAGRVRTDLEGQLRELAVLHEKFPEQVIPFVAVDPRRPNVAELVKRWVEERGFRGIKIYPNLGFEPADPRLDEVWRYAEERGLPVMSHCSRGGVRMKGMKREEVERFNSPAKHVPLMERHPKLRVCLAHFGGGADWNEYFGGDRKDWVTSILELIRSERYPNLYTDISYTIFNFEQYGPVLKVFLADPRVREKVLFGSDYYMTENERFEERFLSMRLRGLLGEELFWQIADVNPRRWLGEA
jgi:uncharacterized protein